MTKEEYRIYAEDVVKDISHRIDELRQRSYGVNEKLRADYDEKVSNLITMKDELEQKIAEFDSIPENRWEEAKAEISKGIDYLKQGFQTLFNVLSS